MTLISRVIKEYTKLEKSGSTFIGKCPFCPEKSITLGVNDKKQMFNCFSCGINGFYDDFVHFAKVKLIEKNH